MTIPDQSDRRQTEIADAMIDIMREIYSALGHATLERTAQLNPPIARLIAAVEAREREQSLALLTALRAIGAADEPVNPSPGWTTPDYIKFVRDRATAALDSYEAAHLQVAHEEAQGE